MASVSVPANLSRARSVCSQAPPFLPTCRRAAATNLYSPRCAEASRSQSGASPPRLRLVRGGLPPWPTAGHQAIRVTTRGQGAMPAQPLAPVGGLHTIGRVGKRPYSEVVGLLVEDIVTRCQRSLNEHTPALAVRDVLRELVADHGGLEHALGPVERGGITSLHNSPDLTVLHVAWTPGMALYPHEHRMWAVIGLYGGQEDNTFFRRGPAGLEQVGGRELPAGDVLVLGDDVIHSVGNTRREFAVALHVYGGDFFSVERSEWDPETHEERPRDLERTRRLFDEANARWRDRL